MRIVFAKLAKHELDDAADFYETEFDGLGKRFMFEVKAAVLRIRKCLLHKFPYKLLYSIELDHILILAVAHQHRKPGYWANRLK
ncbi:MAG: hypothetical protein ACI8P9_004073 [Parasphingorhabdus sp.]|jgi:hypothetical protein